MKSTNRFLASRSGHRALFLFPSYRCSHWEAIGWEEERIVTSPVHKHIHTLVRQEAPVKKIKMKVLYSRAEKSGPLRVWGRDGESLWTTCMPVRSSLAYPLYPYTCVEKTLFRNSKHHHNHMSSFRLSWTTIEKCRLSVVSAALCVKSTFGENLSP